MQPTNDKEVTFNSKNEMHFYVYIYNRPEEIQILFYFKTVW